MKTLEFLLQFLMAWALRSSVLVLSGALILWLVRVKDSSIRLAAWTAMLAGSLAIPILTVALPKVPVVYMRTTVQRITPPPSAVSSASPSVSDPSRLEMKPGTTMPARGKAFDWVAAALLLYTLVAFILLLRVAVGLAIGLRLLRNSHATGRRIEGIEIRQSARVQAPVTLGIMRPAIVLPLDWPQWDSARLDVVVAHEHSHIRRHDAAIQLVSAIHRAVLWHSPLSWFLHNRVVRLAEEVSDDAALAVAPDRAFYADVLIHFMQRGVRGASWLGVPMARYGRADKRIHRILDSTKLSRGVTRWTAAAIVALGSPLAYLAAAAHPQTVTESPETARAGTDSAPAAPLSEAPRQVSTPVKPATGRRVSAPPAQRQRESNFIAGLGTVSAYTVTVMPRVEGQLLSVSFKEGDPVQTGQVLATIDPSAYQLQVAQAEGQLARERAELSEYQYQQKNLAPDVVFQAKVAQIKGDIKTGQAKVDDAKRLLAYTQIISPITGVAGLLLVNPGNMVHTADSLVIINQLEPISVVFRVPEDQVSKVLTALKNGPVLHAEAWNRDLSAKLATGQLTGVDNQVDTETGTVKLKAMFDNKDRALFPNQFVNVRLVLKAE